MPAPLLIPAIYVLSGLLAGKGISDYFKRKRKKTEAQRLFDEQIKPPYLELLQYSKKTMNHLSIAGNVLFSSSASKEINQFIQRVFEQRNGAWGQAMDVIYTKTWIGGSDHRMYDGSHTLWDAWLKGYRATDYPFFESLRKYFNALWNDVVTPKGLPIINWEQEQFKQVQEQLHKNLGIDPQWTKSMANFNAKDLFGATLGSIAILYHWKTKDTKHFADTVSSLGLTAVFSANPILSMITMIGFARAYHLNQKQGKKPSFLKSGTARGLLSTGGFMALTAFFPTTFAIRITLGLVSSLVLRKLYDQVEEDLMEKTDREFPIYKELENSFEKIVHQTTPLMKVNIQEIFPEYRKEQYQGHQEQSYNWS